MSIADEANEYLQKYKSIDATDWTGPQTILLDRMIEFNKVYKGGEGSVQSAVEAYDEDKEGDRFEIPCYNATTAPQPRENILRYRVWHKSTDPEDPGSSQYREYVTLHEALVGRNDLIEFGYLSVDAPIGVCWDNALGCFSECQVLELVKLLKHEKAK